MPIKKQYLKSKPVVKVTYEISQETAQNAKSILLVSEHNGWAPLEMKKFKNGKFKVVADLPIENTSGFQFIYKATAENGDEYVISADGADDYVDNGMTDGGKNAVIRVS